MKILLMLAIVLLASCGRNNTNECRSRESVRLECTTRNTPNYGFQYAQEMCDRSYNAERCW